MTKGPEKFTTGFDADIAKINQDLTERTQSRVDMANAYHTRKIGARVAQTEGRLFNDGAKTREGDETLAKADFTKKALEGVEAISGEPAKNAEYAFRQTDKLPKAPAGKFPVAAVGPHTQKIFDKKYKSSEENSGVGHSKGI